MMNLIFIFNYKKGAVLSSRPNTEILSQHLDCPLLQMQCDQDSPWELASKSGEIWPGILIMKRNIQAVQTHNFHVWSLFLFFFFFLSIERSFPSLKRCGRQPGKKSNNPSQSWSESPQRSRQNKWLLKSKSQVKAPCLSFVVLKKRRDADIYSGTT